MLFFKLCGTYNKRAAETSIQNRLGNSEQPFDSIPSSIGKDLASCWCSVDHSLGAIELAGSPSVLHLSSFLSA